MHSSISRSSIKLITHVSSVTPTLRRILSHNFDWRGSSRNENFIVINAKEENVKQLCSANIFRIETEKVQNICNSIASHLRTMSHKMDAKTPSQCNLCIRDLRQFHRHLKGLAGHKKTPTTSCTFSPPQLTPSTTTWGYLCTTSRETLKKTCGYRCYAYDVRRQNSISSYCSGRRHGHKGKKKRALPHSHHRPDRPPSSSREPRGVHKSNN